MELAQPERVMILLDVFIDVVIETLGMGLVDIGGIDCERAVDINRNAGKLSVVPELVQAIDDILRSPDAERGHDDFPSPLDRAGKVRANLLSHIFRRIWKLS